MSQMRQQMRRVEIRGGTPAPPSTSSTSTCRWIRQVSSAANGERSPASPRQIAAQPEAEIDEDVVYLGWLFNHYGHFLMSRWPASGSWRRSIPTPESSFTIPARRDFSRPAGPGACSRRSVCRRADAHLSRADAAAAADRARAALRATRHGERPDRPRARGDGAPVPGGRAPNRGRRRAVAAAALPQSPPPAQHATGDHRRRLAGGGPAGERVSHRLPGEDVVRGAGSPPRQSRPHRLECGQRGAERALRPARPRAPFLTNGSQFSPDYFMHHTVVGTPTTFIDPLVSTAGPTSLKPASRRRICWIP